MLWMSALAKKGNSPKNAKQKPTEMQKILNIKMPPKRGLVSSFSLPREAASHPALRQLRQCFLC